MSLIWDYDSEHIRQTDGRSLHGAWKDSRRQQTEASVTAELQKNVESCFQEGKWNPLQHILYKKKSNGQVVAIQYSCADSLHPHRLQHTRLPCPSPTPRAYSNSSPSSWWCHPTISSSVIPFSSCLQSFPASGSFQMSQFFASGGHWSFSFCICPSNEYSGLISFRIDWVDLLAVQGTLKSLQHHSPKSSSVFSFLYSPTLTSIHDYWKNHSLNRWAFVGKVMSLLFNMLCRLVITFLPRSKRLLISCWQSPSAVILEPPQNKVSHCFPIYLPWSNGTGCYDLSFLNWALSQLFHSLLSLTSRGSLVPFHFLS